jgi:hypothetical protein
VQRKKAVQKTAAGLRKPTAVAFILLPADPATQSIKWARLRRFVPTREGEKRGASMPWNARVDAQTRKEHLENRRLCCWERHEACLDSRTCAAEKKAALFSTLGAMPMSRTKNLRAFEQASASAKKQRGAASLQSRMGNMQRVCKWFEDGRCAKPTSGPGKCDRAAAHGDPLEILCFSRREEGIELGFVCPALMGGECPFKHGDRKTEREKKLGEPLEKGSTVIYVDGRDNEHEAIIKTVHARGAEAAELEYTIGIPEEMAPGETMPERQTLRARLFDPAEAVTRVRRPAADPAPEADPPSETDPSEAGPSSSTDASAPPPPPSEMDEE